MNLGNQIFIGALITLQLVGAYSTISQVGKDRKPITGSVAAISAVASALIIVGLVGLLRVGS